MPGLLRKLIIFAAVDGLILQPHGPGPRHNGNDSSIRIDYKTNKISSLSPSAPDQSGGESGLEVHGLVGKTIIHSSNKACL